MNRPFFVPLLAIYPVLYISAANPGQAAFQTVLVALTSAFLASVLALLLLRLVFRSWDRAALGAAIIVALFFAYGPLHSLIEGTFLDSLTATVGTARTLQALAPHLHKILTTVWVIVLSVSLWALYRLRWDRLPVIMRACNTMALILIALVVIQWSTQLGPVAHEQRHAPARGLATSVLGYNPDIYIIVLDGYAREDVLRQFYKFDNSEFIAGLARRGFQVIDRSYANYNWTFLSLASVLNMDYVQTLLPEQISPSNRSRAAVYDAIRNSEVARFFRDRGYRIVHFQSTWGATLRNAYADVQVPCHDSIFSNEFYRVLAEASWAKVLQSRLTADLAQCYLSNLDKLGKMGAEPGPKLVFTHFLPPHHPYLFDREGRVLRQANLSNQFEFQKRLWEQKQPYIEQVIFMNRKITKAVDAILAESSRPPIIIIQSDHGPNFDRGLSRQEKVHVRLSNFAAFLLPSAPSDLMPESGSAVNAFRRIVNHYYKAGLVLLPDRYFFSEFADPYRLEEVYPSSAAIDSKPS